MKNTKKSAIILGILVAVIFIAMAVANSIQTNGGKTTITEGYIDATVNDMNGKLFYKLYVPEGVSAENKAPAVLLLHGYQNDHETCGAYAIELAKRGVVVLAIDEYGHGKSTLGLRNRGYVNHKVTVNYGEDSEADGTFTKIGGQLRYKVMMNFSNLSFFNEKYTTDADGNFLTDSSAGGVAAYAFLAELPMVDNTRMGISGHSMGTWSSWSVAAAYSGSAIEPKATVLQCGELFRESVYDENDIHFNNVLLLQAKYDEFSYFRDYKKVVNDDLIKSDLRTEFLGTTADKAAWNTTYGSFADGSARRIELLMTNHRLTTHNKQGLTEAIRWFEDALGFKSGIPADSQNAMTKEWLVFLAMLCGIFALLPLCDILLNTKFFEDIKQPLPPVEKVKTNGQWWKGAIITMLLAFATYPFMTQLGHGLLPLPENVFRMTIGNGFLSWYLLLIIIMVVLSIIGYKKAKKKGETEGIWCMGLAKADAPDKISIALFAKCFVLAACEILFMYILVAICEVIFKLDFRFIWPFFKSFNMTRFGQFLLYLPVFALFFILNNSKIMASARCKATYEPGCKAYFAAWWRVALMMVGGVLLLCLLEYIPFFANIGPGADLLFGSTFGGPFMSLLIVFAQQVIVLRFHGTYIYRRTGSVNTGELIIAIHA
ncbi:MAG: hypothetical protein Q4B67_10120 [Eubacteriales bacterium]|nr:hypothetical protein [Eubacteriales bacterium]